jgi:heme A synthase
MNLTQPLITLTLTLLHAIVAGIVCLLLVVLICYCLWRRRRTTDVCPEHGLELL